MITCDHIVGDWLPGILVPERDEEEDNTMIDTQLNISKEDGKYYALFHGDDNKSEVTCRPISEKRLVISFTRTHNGGVKKTEYKGRVIGISPRGSVGIIKGKFKTNRSRFLDDIKGEIRDTKGDWQTERPT
jgi:hypothetical protein